MVPIFAVPTLQRIRECNDLPSVQSSLNNDAVFRYEKMFAHLLHRTVRMRFETGVEHWSTFRQMIDAIGVTVEIMNYAFVLHGDGASTGEIQALPERLDEVRAFFARFDRHVDRLQRAIADQILDALLRHLILGCPDVDNTAILDDIFVLSFWDPDPAPRPEDSFDVFISYRRAHFSQPARALHDALADRGIRCWLDVEQLLIPPSVQIDPRSIKQKLRDAVCRSRSMVFFETEDEATVDENSRGLKRRYNWQVFELRYASEILVVRPGSPGIVLDGSGGKSTFTTIDQLVKIVEAAPKRPPDAAFQRWHRSHEPRLQDTADRLKALASEYFGDEISISARAALALLAPGAVHAGPSDQIALSDDILVNLLRLSPRAALVLMWNGFDVDRLFGLGAQFNYRRWSDARNLLLDDVFGHRSLGSPVNQCARITQRRYLDELALLSGLLEFAQWKSTYVGGLITRTARAMYPNRSAAQAQDAADQMIAACLDDLRAPRFQFRDQQWLLEQHPGGWQLTPFAVCEEVRLEGGVAPEPTVLRILMVQTDRLFASMSVNVAEFVKALKSSRSSRARDLLDREPDLEFTLAGASAFSVSVVSDLQTRSRHAEPIHFEWPDAAREYDEDLQRRVASAHDFVARLYVAKKWLLDTGPRAEVELGEPNRLDSAPGFPGARRVAIAIGAAPIMVTSPPVMHFCDLHRSLLWRLRRYHEIRQLDCDDLFL